MTFHKVWSTVVTVWKFELWSSAHYPVTVGHIAVAAFVLVVGFRLARFAKHRVRRRLERKARLDSSGILALERITYAVSIIVVLYTVLAILKIPLTVFHFAVGGLMIGIGFGARELFSNLISGFILMAQRPVKIGDVVEVDEEIGRIFNIGLWNVQVHTENNIDIMWPNSKVLNDKLVNWTKDDHMILTMVPIGIAYASDIHNATKLMVKAASNVEGVLPDPAPFVLFKEHGASALVFHVYFAVHVQNKMERWVFESHVNCSLNDTLRNAGVEIAFSQLDVHLKGNVPDPS